MTRVIVSSVREQQRLAELLNIGIDWTWESDAKGRMLSLSPSFQTVTGRSVAEFMNLGQPGGPVVLPTAGFRAWQDAIREQRPYRDLPISIKGRDGVPIHLRGNGRPVFDEHGRLHHWLGVSRDITREVEAAAEQQRTQTVLDRVFAISPDGIGVCRADGRVLMINAGFETMTGLAPQDVIGRRLDETGVWTKAESLRLRDAIAQQQVLHDFRTVLRPRGHAPRQVSISGAVFQWDGADVAVFGARDITELERAKIEADAILDHASIGIALVRNRRMERSNPQLAQMLGRSREQMQGLPVKDLFASDADQAHFEQQLQRSPGGVSSDEIDHAFRRPDGSTVLLRLRARALDPSLDSAFAADTGTIWVAEDVTERRRAERELADARHAAEAANRAKSHFLATMSHEIRTPLNGVLGLARLLQDPALPAARRTDYLQHLAGAASQLSGIVSNVLDLSKIEAGEMPLESLPFDPRELVRGCFDSFAVLGRERGLSMSLAMSPALPARVRGDPTRVRQLLANYLSNALKFTERGGVTVTAEPLAEGGVRLAVQDSGIGVEPALRERLFKPFGQADSSTTRRFGGTGLGLSICRELATRMGGQVGLSDSTLGGGGPGICFWAELPLLAMDASPGEAADRRGTGPGLHGRLVLVAEDNPVNLLIVRAMLERHGVRVIEAHDGQAAVLLAQQHASELHAVLMDLHMPLLDGLAATRQLRATASTSSLCILAVSAAVLAHERRAAEAAGMNGFIGKPVEEAELLHALGLGLPLPLDASVPVGG